MDGLPIVYPNTPRMLSPSDWRPYYISIYISVSE